MKDFVGDDFKQFAFAKRSANPDGGVSTGRVVAISKRVARHLTGWNQPNPPPTPIDFDPRFIAHRGHPTQSLELHAYCFQHQQHPIANRFAPTFDGAEKGQSSFPLPIRANHLSIRLS